jgi:hypothetical protein
MPLKQNQWAQRNTNHYRDAQKYCVVCNKALSKYNNLARNVGVRGK